MLLSNPFNVGAAQLRACCWADYCPDPSRLNGWDCPDPEQEHRHDFIIQVTDSVYMGPPLSQIRVPSGVGGE